MSVVIAITSDEIAQVFIKWMNNYRADPDGFQLFTEETEINEEFGEQCANYFIDLLSEVQEK